MKTFMLAQATLYLISVFTGLVSLGFQRTPPQLTLKLLALRVFFHLIWAGLAIYILITES